MAKRFTDTEKWKKPFIRGLNSAYKLLWFYICDDCDNAGIWQVDIEVAQIRIGENINEEDAINAFGDKIILLENGAKWFIPPFIDFQYPSGLNSANNAHSGVIKALERYNLLEKNEGLTRGSQAPMDMYKDKDKDITNTEDAIFKKIKHLKITKGEYEKVLQNGYTEKQVADIFDAIENYAKIKNYNSLYLTSLKWLKREYPEVTEKQKQTAVEVDMSQYDMSYRHKLVNQTN